MQNLTNRLYTCSYGNALTLAQPYDRNINGSNFIFYIQMVNPNFSTKYTHKNLVEFQNLLFLGCFIFLEFVCIIKVDLPIQQTL